MSDSEGDFSDELLELAGASSKKRKTRQGALKKSKRRKQNDVDLGTESEDMPESEEEEDANPYPLEGKYKDEADRSRLNQLSEIEREEILAQRLEEIQRLQDKRNLDQMVKAQGKQSGEPESVAKAAKRQHAVKGATKEKTKKLDELKAKRKAHDEKKRTKGPHSPKRDRSSSPTDMEMSSEDDEDGQINKFEEEEERDRKIFSKPDKADDAITVQDLNRCRLTRDKIAKFCMAPFFEEYVKGAYVRYLIGQEKNQPVYRICEIYNLAADVVKPYKINDQMVNQQFELKHGKSAKVFPMDKVSNSEFNEHEFERWTRICQADEVKIPTKRQIDRKVEQMGKLAKQDLSEADIAQMLLKRKQLNSSSQSSTSTTMERSRLIQARTLASRRQDWAEVAQLTAELDSVNAAAGPDARTAEEDMQDRLAKVNERNRKANLEAMRKAELLEAERKRMKRKLEPGRGGSRTGTPDPTRLRPGTFSPAVSRPGTPSNGPTNGTALTPIVSSLTGTESSLTDSNNGVDATMIDDVEVDLGDF